MSGYRPRAVNLYPFEKTVAREDVSLDEAWRYRHRGPTMLRGAAKITVCDGPLRPSDYDAVSVSSASPGGVPSPRAGVLRPRCSAYADYDSAIDRFLAKRFLDEEVLRLSYRKGIPLRYGENWHQSAMFFRDEAVGYPSLATAEQIWGKQLSYNNYIDMTAAVAAVKDFATGPAVSVIKHTNPCGLATGRTAAEALRAAWDGDRVSAYGSVIGCTVPFDGAAAEFLSGKWAKAFLRHPFLPTTHARTLGG